jgi:tetratricopeptide (TPR) repeat protein
VSAAPLRRNDPCPCGSGKRYKDCHGSLSAPIAPPSIDAMIASALNFHRQGLVDQAERGYRDILSRDPSNAVATHYLGMATWQRGDLAEAERLIRASIAANPAIADFHNNLGLLLRDTRRTAEAIAAYRKTLQVDPGWFEAYNNLGLALEDAGRFDEALEAYRTGFAREPRFAAARQNLARLLVTMGRYAEGWEQYRWRRLAQGASATPPDPDARRLPASLAGRRLLLAAEQGIGDILFFLRFAPELVTRDATLAFRGDARLHPMLERTGLFKGGLVAGFEPVASDETIAIGDLPWLLGANDARDFPPPLALTPLPERVEAMRARLESAGPAPRIALTWRAGSTNAGPRQSQLKTIPLDAFGKALRGRRATWIGIQRLEEPEERDTLSRAMGAPVHDFSKVNDDLEDMLALLSLVDDYIGVSNANTHLRAALRGSMQVLVPFPPEWRWSLEGECSPWFPRMRVLRQAAQGEWGAALAALRA